MYVSTCVRAMNIHSKFMLKVNPHLMTLKGAVCLWEMLSPHFIIQGLYTTESTVLPSCPFHLVQTQHLFLLEDAKGRLP